VLRSVEMLANSLKVRLRTQFANLGPAPLLIVQ
jgi:hypothetical protein